MSSQEQFALYDYLEILKKRKLIAGLCFGVTLTATFLYSHFSIPVYQTDTIIELKTGRLVVSLKGTDKEIERNINTEVIKIRSYPIIRQTLQKLDLLPGDSTAEKALLDTYRRKIATYPTPKTRLIKIVLTHEKPDEILKIANTVTEVYIANITAEENQRLLETKKFIQQQLQITREELEELEEACREFTASGKITEKVHIYGSKLINLRFKRSDLSTRYGEQHPELIKVKTEIAEIEDKLGKLTGEELKYLRVLRETKIDEDMYRMLRFKLKEASIEEYTGRIIPAEIVQRAKTIEKIRPNKTLNICLGILCGSLIAFLVVFITEELDVYLKTSEEIETTLQIPVLSEVPHCGKRRLKKTYPLIYQKEIDADFIEAFNTLETNIGFNLPPKESQKRQYSVVFTSISPDEGKTLILANYGIITAQRGYKTLLIDADLRHPKFHKIFGLPQQPGLTDILFQKLTYKQVIHTGSAINGLTKDKSELFNLEKLAIMTSGYSTSFPLNIFNSPELERLLKELKDNYDFIGIDSPPVGYFTDPLVLAAKTSGMVMVCKSGKVDRRTLLRTKEQILRNNIGLVGVVLNEVYGKKSKYYYYQDNPTG